MERLGIENFIGENDGGGRDLDGIAGVDQEVPGKGQGLVGVKKPEQAAAVFGADFDKGVTGDGVTEQGLASGDDHAGEQGAERGGGVEVGFRVAADPAHGLAVVANAGIV